MEFEPAINIDCLTIVAEYLPKSAVLMLVKLLKCEKLRYSICVNINSRKVSEHPGMVRKLDAYIMTPELHKFISDSELEHLHIESMDTQLPISILKDAKMKSLDIEEINVELLPELISNIDVTELTVGVNPIKRRQTVDLTKLKLSYLDIYETEYRLSSMLDLRFPAGLCHLRISANISNDTLDRIAMLNLDVLEICSCNHDEKCIIRSNARVARVEFVENAIQLDFPRCELLEMYVYKENAIKHIPRIMLLHSPLATDIPLEKDETGMYITENLEQIELPVSMYKPEILRKFPESVRILPSRYIIEYEDYKNMKKYDPEYKPYIYKLLNIRDIEQTQSLLPIKVLHFADKSFSQYPHKFDELIITDYDEKIVIRKYVKTLVVENAHEKKRLNIHIASCNYINLHNFRGILTYTCNHFQIGYIPPLVIKNFKPDGSFETRNVNENTGTIDFREPGSKSEPESEQDVTIPMLVMATVFLTFKIIKRIF